MAFTGAAVLTYVSDSTVRITGLSLAASANGTISLLGGTGAVKVDQPTWNRYTNGRGVTIDLDSSVKCHALLAAAGVATAVPISVVKTGNGPTDLLITLANGDGAAVSGALEIWVEFKGG